MGDLTDTLKLSAGGMQAQATRLRHVTENIANADTPGYRRKLTAFRQAMAAGAVETGPVTLDPGALERVYDPAHPLADENGQYLGSNVDLVIEIADAREAQRSYEANLRMFDQARQMTRSLLEILRR
ncbi:flagellar basal-body rod protein FlgC [Rhodovulum iodosum]|uniref:Flagellar basal-body rod protein FlgC n=1 Tax=Rhodovulum iodosum TaxID=68291 RepID=A0ABV3XRF5_9RHOB|nr:flagellar basal body rod protein FlgC [Rhodovulum robiginosum]RSK40019.1 flagellar basal body rod protein FlgC [Rhodovulum robiginosum]